MTTLARRTLFGCFLHSSYFVVFLYLFCYKFSFVGSLQIQEPFNLISEKQSVIDNFADDSSWFPNTPTRTSVTTDLAEETTKGLTKLFPFLESMDRRAFLPSFIQSLFMILVTELGDKTFFIAAIMAMKNSRILVFQGALCALLCMTLLSVALGKTFPLLISKKYTSLAAGVLFAYFGIQLLRDWWQARSNSTWNVDEELNELEEQISTGSYHSESTESRLHMSLSSDSIASRNKYTRSNSTSASNGQLHHNTAASTTFHSFVSKVALLFFSPVFVRSFSLTFLAEWGDRSQVATVALSASKDMYGVCIGAIAGHFMCTGLAVLGGRLLASRISERTVACIGGILFLIFSVLSLSGQLE
ncbi:hypothetical protein GpartN1_g6620.t1 [Galdieria partita]|uniref:GDT1 family protein n=1 Tax=Galdieria partita TaxID=83374 RepID=A0A9C7UT40_9RHOD|nr:hypothetical protein GpartN1_g903.t1 [Galdieria partita]GJQ14829.1 hypothetical protein GpartN1_g6620.t1 [Galdieria partita]